MTFRDYLLLEGLTSKDFLKNTKINKRTGQRVAKIQGKEIEYSLGKKNAKGGYSALAKNDDESKAEVIMIVMPSGKMAFLNIT